MAKTENFAQQSEPAAYDTKFFDFIERQARSSAARIVPHVVRLVEPSSVVDVGCGRGAWLAEFERMGITDATGIDGDWVQEAEILFRYGHLVHHDLGKSLGLERRFDLVVSLETAEHLPPSRGPGFVADLVTLGDVVLFSAALPRQGGVGHVNEQWPDYWAELFREHDYLPIDCVGWQFWNDPDVAYFYAQNMFLVIRASALPQTPALHNWVEHHPDRVGTVPPVVHPGPWLLPPPPIEVGHSTREIAGALVGRTVMATRLRARRPRGPA